MDHGPNADWGEDKACEYKTSIGVKMVVFYGIVYAGFILINTLFPKVMGITVFLGINLAVVYGYTLILLAIVLGVIYNFMCTSMEDKLNKEGDE